MNKPFTVCVKTNKTYQKLMTLFFFRRGAASEMSIKPNYIDVFVVQNCTKLLSMSDIEIHLFVAPCVSDEITGYSRKALYTVKI